MKINYASRLMTHDEWWETTGRRNRELAEALGSRPLTVDELQRVVAVGYHLLCSMNQPYTPSEKQREFADLLSIQQSIQFAASREARDAPPAADAGRTGRRLMHRVTIRVEKSS